MGKDKKTPITIEDQEYAYEDLTEQQQMLFNHVADLDRKLASARFNLDQLAVGRDSFFNMLKQSLSHEESEDDGGNQDGS